MKTRQPVMHTFMLFVLIQVFLGSYNVSAATYRVNADLISDEAKGLFSTLTQAHNYAKAGDTLLVDGATKIYDNLTVTKRLVIIGTGYLLEENKVNQVNRVTSKFTRVNFNAGSEGSVLIGAVLAVNSSFNEVQVNVSDISLQRSHIKINVGSDISRLGLSQNLIESFSFGSFRKFDGFEMRNNIVNVNHFNAENRENYPRVFSIVENNIFSGRITLTAAIFRNNIIADRTATVNITSTNNDIRNNLAAQLVTVHNSNIDFDTNNLFVGLSGSNNSPDGQYRLKSGSSYRDKGYQNAEPGIFGGLNPYLISGLPPVPVIYELEAEAVTTKEKGLNVRVKARTQQ